MSKATEKANRINYALRAVPNAWAEVRKNGRQVVLVQGRPNPISGLDDVEMRDAWDVTGASPSELAMQLGEIVQLHTERGKVLREFLSTLKEWLENDEPHIDLIALAEDWREAGHPGL